MSAPLDIDEAAAYLHVTRRTMYKLVKARKVASHQPGRRRLFYVEDLEAYARLNRRASQAELNAQADEILAEILPAGRA